MAADKFLGINEAAEFLGVAKATVYNYTSKRLIPYYKMKQKVLFRQSELIKWMEQFRVRTMEEIDREATKYVLTHETK